MEIDLMQVQITAEHIITIFSAIGSSMLIVLGGIWRELRGLRTQLAAVVVKSVSHDEKIIAIVDRLDRLPCDTCRQEGSHGR